MLFLKSCVMIKENSDDLAKVLNRLQNSEIEVLSHIQTDWRIDMADGTITAKQKEILEYIKQKF